MPRRTITARQRLGQRRVLHRLSESGHERCSEVGSGGLSSMPWRPKWSQPVASSTSGSAARSALAHRQSSSRHCWISRSLAVRSSHPSLPDRSRRDVARVLDEPQARDAQTEQLCRPVSIAGPLQHRRAVVSTEECDQMPVLCLRPLGPEPHTARTVRRRAAWAPRPGTASRSITLLVARFLAGARFVVPRWSGSSSRSWGHPCPPPGCLAPPPPTSEPIRVLILPAANGTVLMEC